MERTHVNADDAPQTSGRYSQAVSISGQTRTLFVSGQIPVDRDGFVPTDFSSQAKLVWRNIAAQLISADMGLSDIVKVTTYLSDRRFADANGAARREALGDNAPALTVIVCDIFDRAWLLEIEVIAVK
jgi:2-iminobutanoate/2-iminopropanoate deaminase